MIVDAKSQSLEEMVYQRLEQEILSGELQRGEALGEIALAKRLGVSRTPIRGALHRLSEEGLVEISPNRGASVLGINIDDLVDIYTLRERVEGLASALAATRITDEELARLTEAVDEECGGSRQQRHPAQRHGHDHLRRSQRAGERPECGGSVKRL